MSGSAKNVQRDCTWIEPKTADELTWPTASAPDAATITANAKTATHVDKANAYTRATATIAAGTLEVIGVYMNPPEGDNTPYRVKASVVADGVGKTTTAPMIVIGYGPASPTGSNDSIDEPYLIPFTEDCDDIFMVPALDSGDGNYGNPLFIGVGMMALSAISGLNVVAHISVQHMGVKPPTMQMAVS